MSQSEILGHLAALVACDTQNPPREISGDSPIIDYCRAAVEAGFEVEVADHGDGHVSFYAIRGRPGVLFNVHIDTVPCGHGWSGNPLELAVREGRAFGRGACDIKGAAACLLTIAASRPDHMAFLFTSDEEAPGARCVRAFCESGKGERFGQVVVAEPTSCRAILGHRGFLSARGQFRGIPGHSSEARALEDNAIHRMVNWADQAMKLARRRNPSEEVSGTCLNIGTVKGGTANNVIAGEVEVTWSARLQPGTSNREFLEDLKSCEPEGAGVEWDVDHIGEPLPAGGHDDQRANDFAQRHGLSAGKPVDFWTEAAIFSEFGLPALVLGPGDIEQAHIDDEWVAVDQLGQAANLYHAIIEADG